jgi:predicted RNase H-like nuclease
VDGCGPKWLAIAQEPGRRHYVAKVLATEELAGESWDLIAIDIPIGLPDCSLLSTSLRERLFEVHPEVSFAAWNEGPMLFPKRHREGHQSRRDLIARHFGADAFDSVAAQVRGEKVAVDDIADAFAALWSANRILMGAAGRFPASPQFDSLGLPMHIWY